MARVTLGQVMHAGGAGLPDVNVVPDAESDNDTSGISVYGDDEPLEWQSRLEAEGLEVGLDPSSAPELEFDPGLDPGNLGPMGPGDEYDEGDTYYQAGGPGLDEFDLGPAGGMTQDVGAEGVPGEYLEPEPWHKKYRTELYIGGGAALLLAVVLYVTRKGDD